MLLDVLEDPEAPEPPADGQHGQNLAGTAWGYLLILETKKNMTKCRERKATTLASPPGLSIPMNAGPESEFGMSGAGLGVDWFPFQDTQRPLPVWLKDRKVSEPSFQRTLNINTFSGIPRHRVAPEKTSGRVKRLMANISKIDPDPVCPPRQRDRRACGWPPTLPLLQLMATYSSVTYDDRLPERTHIPLLASDEIRVILIHLRDTYNPPVRGTRIVTHRKILLPPTDDMSASTVELRHPLAGVGESNPLDRKLVCDWLTSLISALQKHLSKGGDDSDAREALLDDAAALLAIFAGSASAGKLTRTFTFGHPPSTPVRVRVTDIPLENQDYTTLGAQTWGGAHVLAEIIVQNPHHFGLHSEQTSAGGPSILELGAGTGLASLAVYRYLWSRGLCATIYATDFNSLILDNLAHNISINKLAVPGSTEPGISCGPLDWSNPDAANSDLFNSVDFVLGADIIYEELHARWIRTCLQRFMRKPQLNSVHRPLFHLVVPLRPTHAFESNTIEGIFPLWSETSGQRGWELVVFSKDSILCEASGDEADGQVEYVYYTIGWENKTSETKHNNNAC